MVGGNSDRLDQEFMQLFSLVNNNEDTLLCTYEA